MPSFLRQNCRLSIGLLGFFFATACASVNAPNVPAGANKIGCPTVLFDEAPKLSDISGDSTVPSKFYEGQWWAKRKASLEYYSEENGVLALSLGGDISTLTREMRKGLLPLIKGNSNFYVEFETWISENDDDHWPAVWLMPQEHNNKHDDHFEGDPPGFERWVEVDVDEGGYGPGLHGTLINWQGIWPGYKKTQQRVLGPKLDRTRPHRFGFSYDFVRKRAQWWIDDHPLREIDASDYMKIAQHHNYYFLISVGSHKLKKPFKMYVNRVKAFTCEPTK